MDATKKLWKALGSEEGAARGEAASGRLHAGAVRV
jgi:hypothetical protein